MTEALSAVPHPSVVDQAGGPNRRDAPPLRLWRWVVEGGRTMVLMRPRWERLHAGPGSLLALLLLSLGLSVGMQRLWVEGPADFHAEALFAGWLTLCASAWLCHALLPRQRVDPRRSPGAAWLFELSVAQGVWLALVYFGLMLLSSRWDASQIGYYVWWGISAGALLIGTLAYAVMLARGSGRPLWAALGALLVLGVSVLESYYNHRAAWSARDPDVAEAPAPEWLQLTQSLMERQPRLLNDRLEALAAQRPGVVDLYALTFAPYAHEDVFRRESAMVAEVMAQRFGTAERTLQLVNHLETLEQWPWATPLNLGRSIHHVARVMDLDEDILFIHLTSHGAADGELSASFWPMSVETVTPERLKAWLDEAGVRYRVISVSACYSGSWIAPLADEYTLVMTAADADNTSYGCGRLSELTFFGRAVFDEQLRNETRSFEAAHAAARPIIDRREREAGKDDGYSNPQIHVGERIRERLEVLEQGLAAGGAH